MPKRQEIRMVDDASGLEIVITLEEANSHFDSVCKLRHPNGKELTQDEVGDLLSVDQGTISRNQKRRKKGAGITKKVFENIAEILRDREIERLKEKQQQEQDEADRLAEATRQADEQDRLKCLDAQRIADEAQERQKKQDDKAESDRRAGVHAKMQTYWDSMRAQGMFKGVDPATQGDAPALLDRAQPSDIAYPSHDLAMIALAPADFRFPCGQTAAQLREGRTAWHRLRGKYPKRTNKAELVPSILRPDADLHYAKDYQHILRWQRLNGEHRALVLEPLPLVVSPETAKAFHEFFALDRALCDKGYKFMDSCLRECEDIEKRLKAIKWRKNVPIVAIGVLKGLKWQGFVATALMAIVIAFFVCWGIWELGKWVVDTVEADARAAFEWLYRIKVYIGVVVAGGAVMATALLLARPRDDDRKNFPGKNVSVVIFFMVVSFAALLVTLLVVWGFIFAHLEETHASYIALTQAFSKGLYIP